jgi:3-dehydrosphinganine reductase
MFEWIGIVVVWWIGVCATVGTLQYVWSRFVARRQLEYRNKHVLISGASTGLGFAFAQLAASRGAKLSIVSLNEARLSAAVSELQRSSEHAVHGAAVDVGDAARLADAVKRAEAVHGPVDVVVACAGLAAPGLVEDVDVGVYERQMRLNYLGSVHLVKAALPGMIRRGGGGQVVLVSSACGLISFAGYSAYCPTKWAVRAFADVLRNELQRYGINVAIFHPSNIDSPGFEQENRSKPASTRAIEGAAALISPATAAAMLDDGLQRGQFHITTELMSELLRVGVNGISRANNVLLDSLVAPLLPLIAAVVVRINDAEASKEARKKTV